MLMILLLAPAIAVSGLHRSSVRSRPVPETALPSAGSVAAASPALPTARARATVVVMDEVGDARLLGAVRRTTGVGRQDLIFIRRSAMDPAFLATLARALEGSIGRHGTVPSRRVNIYFMKSERWRTPTSAELTWANQVIAQLSAGKVRNFGNVGDHVAVDTQLPY